MVVRQVGPSENKFITVDVNVVPPASAFSEFKYVARSHKLSQFLFPAQI